jgi:hypothetical protein
MQELEQNRLCDMSFDLGVLGVAHYSSIQGATDSCSGSSTEVEEGQTDRGGGGGCRICCNDAKIFHNVLSGRRRIGTVAGAAVAEAAIAAAGKGRRRRRVTSS